jgi:hypothetical protein
MKLAHLLLPTAGAGQQPADDGDAIERGAQRRETVGRADEALGAALLDCVALGRGARRYADGVPGADELARELAAAAAAADDEDPGDGGEDVTRAALARRGLRRVLAAVVCARGT